METQGSLELQPSGRRSSLKVNSLPSPPFFFFQSFFFGCEEDDQIYHHLCFSLLCCEEEDGQKIEGLSKLLGESGKR